MKDWLDLNRREFLAALGAFSGSAACAWGAPRSWFLEYAGDEHASARERFVNTGCPMCPGGCGLKVRVVHGCAVGVRGNKDHPINRGGLCSRASAVLQDVYNPDRIQRPLRLTGPRGSGRWEEIDWDSAIALLVERLRNLRDQGRPERLCTLLGRDRGLARVTWKRFARAFGSPNLIDVFPEDNLGVLPAALATHGVRHRLGYDVANAAYVLSFSSGWLDAHWSTEQAARAFADFRRGRAGFRPKWVHAEPRCSLTGTKADEWVPIHPGTEGTLALGIAHVMIREGLYDRPFVEGHGYGFEDWTDAEGTAHTGFRRAVLQDYPPARVQDVTGVPEGTIFRLAREFSGERPAIALGFDGGGCGAQGCYDRMAIHALNALAGSIDVPGGVTLFPGMTLLEEDAELDEIAAKGLSMPRLDGPPAKHRLADRAVDLLAEALEAGQPYAPEVLILAEADPVFALAEGQRFGAALSKVPFVAAISAYHNDSTRYADLILPSLHRFHRWDFDVGYTLRGHPVVTVSQPVMDPPPEVRDPYTTVRSVALGLGGAMERALPWADGHAAVRAVLKELFDQGKGAAFGPAHEEGWAQLLETHGWRAPFADKIEPFEGDVLAGGGWTDPIYFHGEWDRVFRSPPGKFAFSSAYLARSFEAQPDPGAPADDDRRCLPCGPTEAGVPDETYPLQLYVYPLPNLVAVSSPNLPWLNDIAGAYMFEKWSTWVEIHPETAERFGLTKRDHVEVRTARGKLVLPVKIYAGLSPGVIAVPFGFGHHYGGRWCAGIGENPADLVQARTDPLTGRALWSPTRAVVRKVSQRSA